MELVAVAALTHDRVIGAGDGVPWPSVPADTEQYHARVAGAPVILGRKTFDSMRGGLVGARQVVLSRSTESFDVETAVRAASVDEAVALAAESGADTAYVLGGGEIYTLFLPRLDRMVLSRIPGQYDGDTYFPRFDESTWSLERTTEYDEFTLEEWTRHD